MVINLYNGTYISKYYGMTVLSPYYFFVRVVTIAIL